MPTNPTTTVRILTPIEQMAYQLNFDTLALFGGLAVLAKDLMEFISLKGYRGEAVDKFRNALACVLDENRTYLQCFYPEACLRLDEADPPLLDGFAVRAANGNFNLVSLTGRWQRIKLEPGYDHTPTDAERDEMNKRLKEDVLNREWLKYIGWEFFKKYCVEFTALPEMKNCETILQEPLGCPEDRVASLVKIVIEKWGLQCLCWWHPLLVFMVALKVFQCQKEKKCVVPPVAQDDP